MGQERVDQALQRIERALARLEGAADRRPREGGGPQAGLPSDYDALVTKHRSLCRKVEGAIGQIDRLLAGAERG